MNNMVNDKHVKDYCERKVVDVIDSCTTIQQLNCAAKYASLYYKKHNDATFYMYFLKFIKNKASKLRK